jgi:hypothetical protein
MNDFIVDSGVLLDVEHEFVVVSAIRAITVELYAIN